MGKDYTALKQRREEGRKLMDVLESILACLIRGRDMIGIWTCVGVAVGTLYASKMSVPVLVFPFRYTSIVVRVVSDSEISVLLLLILRTKSPEISGCYSGVRAYSLRAGQSRWKLCFIDFQVDGRFCISRISSLPRFPPVEVSASTEGTIPSYG